jgi:hypothetical protein
MPGRSQDAAGDAGGGGWRTGGGRQAGQAAAAGGGAARSRYTTRPMDKREGTIHHSTMEGGGGWREDGNTVKMFTLCSKQITGT